MSVWYTIAKGMIERGAMSQLVLENLLLKFKRITQAEFDELLAMWIAKINPPPPAPPAPEPEPVTEGGDGGEVDAPSGPVNGSTNNDADGGTQP